MADRLISADALEKEIQKLIDEAKSGRFDYGLPWAMLLLSQAPTIEAEPRKHGHWKFTFRALRSVPVDADITCSVCGATFNRTFGTRFIYCPHCGAMMDEVEE